jgi:hypothetical protein
MVKVMERYRGLIEDGAIFLLMAVFTAMKQLLVDDSEIDWPRTFSKIFTNLIAGVGFYSFLLAYKPWYCEYPQKVGIIMLVTYGGSRLIDIGIDKFFKWIRNTDFKDIIRKILDL